jgi:hypothetical protein
MSSKANANIKPSKLEKNDAFKNKYSIYCDKCDNILDISRTSNKPLPDNELLSETPKALSSDTNKEKEDVDYEAILKKIEKGEKVSNEELGSIDIKDLVKNEYYKKMTKKGEIKKSIIDMIEDMGNADENVHAYMVCKNCGYSKTIDPGFRVMTKNPEGIAATHNYINEASYRNKIHIRTMPITRNFNCPNKNCPVYTNKLPPEAIFFRKNEKSYETVYVCKRCLTIKMN